MKKEKPGLLDPYIEGYNSIHHLTRWSKELFGYINSKPTGYLGIIFRDTPRQDTSWYSRIVTCRTLNYERALAKCRRSLHVYDIVYALIPCHYPNPLVAYLSQVICNHKKKINGDVYYAFHPDHMINSIIRYQYEKYGTVFSPVLVCE